MIETQTYRGLWWLPSDPGGKHEGTLTIAVVTGFLGAIVVGAVVLSVDPIQF